jgi:3-oxoacyl-[acyl-carrier-protein] synthase-3
MNTMRKVGLESWGVYLPSHFHTSEYISKETGIAKEVLEDKFGIHQKTVPGPNDHTVAMGAKASIQAMKRINLTAEDLDLIIWAGEVYAEHPLICNGIKLQQLLGNPVKPWAFDVNQRCGTFLIGIQIAKLFMQSDPSYQRVLVASGYRNCDLIDYKNERSRFMTSLAASGVAAILKADYHENEILGISVITDGHFADDVYVPAGGTVEPITVEAIKNRRNYLDVPDPQGLKDRLDKKSMDNFVRVIDDALSRSKMTRADIDFLALLHMKRSAFDYVAHTVGVDPVKQSVYLEDLGHNGQNDGIIAIDMGIKQKKIKNGSVVVIAAAGIGWAWNAGVIKWGKIL